jgi:hypothetical protein
MGMDETFVIPWKRRGPNGMFTLREIFYNGKLSRCVVGDNFKIGEC